MNMDVTHFVWNLKTTRLDVCDIPADVLVFIFSLLHGQDIARCIRVCRCFAELVHSDLYLQYKIELAQNSMVDGDTTTLSVSERLKCLREYSSNFESGIFDHEDLAAHPDYVLQMRNLRWNTVVPADSSLSDLYGQGGRSDLSLSVFTPGSAQAGIQSRRCLLPIGTAGGQGLVITKWAIDGAQDLLVMAEIADVVMPEQLRRRPDEVHIRFYSLSGSRTTRPIPHPAATLPSVHVCAPAGIHNDMIKPTAVIIELCIARQYVIWELAVTRGEVQSFSVEVCNWMTGEVISRIDVGTRPVHVIPLDDPYLLVIPKAFEAYPHLSIYSFSPSDIPSRPVCTLQLPDETPGERVVWHEVYTGDRPQASEGHFRADLSLSMVVLSFYVRDTECEYETHLLVPRATLLAQIRTAASRQMGTNSSGPQSVLTWADWGPQGCLRLQLRRAQSTRRILLIPFGSRLPLVVYDGPDPRSASVYVFDINPLAARHRRQVLAAHQHGSKSEEPGTAGIIEDIEAVLPGVVDPRCSAIPYIAYRFKLPYDPLEWQFGHMIRSVVMSMTGFTVKFAGVEYERTLQTWTV